MFQILNVTLNVQHYKDFTQAESTDICAQHRESLLLYLSGISILSYLNEGLFDFKLYLHDILMFEWTNDSLLTLDSLGFVCILRQTRDNSEIYFLLI